MAEKTWSCVVKSTSGYSFFCKTKSEESKARSELKRFLFFLFRYALQLNHSLRYLNSFYDQN